MYVDRESLLRKKKAGVIVRPRLFINNTAAPLKLLEEVTLSIASFDEDNVKSLKEISNFPLFDDRDSWCEFQVSDNVRSLTFELRAKVKLISQNNRSIDLRAEQRVQLNQIDSTNEIKDEHLRYLPSGYRVMVLGKYECMR